ncbi:hypothetical protein GGR56DRAFT_666580 [Xylariaceae sp. FL0804]|nr:hypothetical protein GGR56DRAFT_666580 [Xylariaceae sp. FL0804]
MAAVEAGHLPYPAAKLVIGQHLWLDPSSQTWAWLIVGSFYDDKGCELWQTEIFLDSDSGHASDTSTLILPRSQARINQLPPNPFTVHPPPAHLPVSMSGLDGWNPRAGWDVNRQAGNAPMMGGGFVPPPAPGGMPYPAYAPPPAYGMAPAPYAFQGMAGAYAAPPPPGPAPVFQNSQGRYPQPHPVVSYDCPGLNLVNSTGGAGCEPGYNYIFPAEHTKIHVLKSSTPPWHNEAKSSYYSAFMVPTDTTIETLMARFGAFNSKKKLNKVTEVVEGGGGFWHRGIVISGDQKDKIKKTLRDFGWDASRTGRRSEKPAVWLWITKD